MADNYRSDLTGLYNHLLNNGFKLPDHLKPDVNGLLSCMNLLNVTNPDKVIPVGNVFCNVLHNITKYHLENEYKNALASNNEQWARVCYNKLIQITNSNRSRAQSSVMHEKTNVPCVPKRFVFAERLLNETVFKFKGSEGNENSSNCNNEQTNYNIQPNVDTLRSKLSLNSNSRIQLRNESDNDEYSAHRARSDQNRTTRNTPTISNMHYANYLNTIDGNPTSVADNKINSKQADDLLIQNKSKHDLQTISDHRSKSMKINDYSEKITKRNDFLDKVNKEVESRKNDNKVSNNSRNKGSKINENVTKKNENKIKRRNSKNNSKGLVTPVKKVSKIPQRLINSIELFQKKRRRESIKDNSTSSNLRPRCKRPRTSSSVSVIKSKKPSRRIVKKVDSDVKSYNSYNCSNNISTDASGCTLLSTPVSTYSYRGDRKRRVFYRRNLFSTPRRQK